MSIQKAAEVLYHLYKWEWKKRVMLKEEYRGERWEDEEEPPMPPIGRKKRGNADEDA